MSSNKSNFNTILLLIITVIIVGVVLRQTAAVFVPLAISVICLYIFTPVLRFLRNRLHLPRLLAVVIVMGLFISASTMVGYVLYSSLRSLVGQYPVYEERFTAMIAGIAQRYNLTDLNTAQFFESLGVREALGQVLLSFSGGSISFISGLMLVAIFLLFLLLEDGVILRNVIGALNKEQGGRVKRIIKNVNDKVGRYMLAKLFISFATAVVVYVGFLIIGVDFPFVWGVLTFLFNFIPNIGSILITILATLFAIIQFAPSWGGVVLAGSLISVTEVVFGNIIEPRMVGRNLNINTVVILLSVLIWAIVWGVSGMFLSVPMTVLMISVMEEIPLTRPISVMMGARQAN